MATAGRRRTKIPPAVRDEVLLEACYSCGNPRCRNILTLDAHHIKWVMDRGGNETGNLIALCGYCHDQHTQGYIPERAIRHWKGLLVALNHAFTKESMDLLLFLHRLGADDVWYSGDGLLRFASLVGAGLVEVAERASAPGKTEKGAELAALVVGDSADIPYVRPPSTAVRVRLTAKGRALVESWLAGDQEAFEEAIRRG
jgi:hypothetical protein